MRDQIKWLTVYNALQKVLEDFGIAFKNNLQEDFLEALN
jgi:hypothetical protein